MQGGTQAYFLCQNFHSYNLSDENKIWTVTAKDPESIVNPTKLEMKTTAWGSGLDMEQMRYMRFNGQLRMPYKG